jgi:hypothetical protein
MGTVFAHRSPSLFLSPGPSGSQAPSFKERALHHVAGPFPSRVYDGRSITVNAPSHHDGGSLTSEAAATKSPRYKYPLIQANQALADLRAGRFEGAAVLTAE